MHTNRVAPSCSITPSIPGQILFWMATVFNCIAGGLVVRSPLKKQSKPNLNALFFFGWVRFIVHYVISLYYFKVKQHEAPTVLK